MGYMKPRYYLSIALLSGSLLAGGCATKKYVRGQISPVDTRVSQVEKKTGEHTSAIGELENSVSRADERAIEADKKAMAAGDAASRANQSATQAGLRADEARNMSQQNTSRIGDLQHTLENYDNYKMVADDSVLFRFGSADLTREAQAKLDQFAQNMNSMRRYVVEVQGYTDPIGNRQYNLALSQRRADSVIRYLMTKHNIPLRNLHVIGLGAEQQMAADGKALTRKEARRVEMKLYAPEAQPASRQMESRSTPPGE